MSFLIFNESASLPTSYPSILATPLVLDIRQQSILTVVVFPAPFGPRNPKTSPSSTRSVTPSTAVSPPNFLVRFSVSIKLHRSVDSLLTRTVILTLVLKSRQQYHKTSKIIASRVLISVA